MPCFTTDDDSCGDGCGCDFGCRKEWDKMKYGNPHQKEFWEEKQVIETGDDTGRYAYSFLYDHKLINGYCINCGRSAYAIRDNKQRCQASWMNNHKAWTLDPIKHLGLTCTNCGISRLNVGIDRNKCEDRRTNMPMIRVTRTEDTYLSRQHKPGYWTGHEISKMDTSHLRNAILFCETKHRTSFENTSSVLRKMTIDEMFPEFNELVEEGKRRGIVEIPLDEQSVYYVTFYVKTGKFPIAAEMVFRQMFQYMLRKIKKSTGLAEFWEVKVSHVRTGNEEKHYADILTEKEVK